MSISMTRRGLAVLGLMAALLVGTLAAASQAQATTIYACYKKTAGTVRIVTAKAKCKKGEAKVSWGTTGKDGVNGAPGATGAGGANGKEGGAGKEGKEGKAGKEGAPGKEGPAGTALAYAEVSSTGTLGANSKGVSKMSPGGSPSTGVYCLSIPGTLHNGVATSNSFGGGTVPSIEAVDLAPIFEIIFGECAEGTTVAVHTYNVKGESVEAGFFLALN